MTTVIDTMVSTVSDVITTAQEMMTSTEASVTSTPEMMTSTTASKAMMTTTTAAPIEEPLSKHLHYAMGAVVGPIICILGMVGNILAIIVWNRPGMTSSTGRYLTAQAVADFGVLFFFILNESAQLWDETLATRISYGIFFCYIVYPLFFFFIISSIWITVGVTIDRYIMVCWIAKAKQFCNTKHAHFGILIICINCFLINIPHFISFRPVYHEGNSTGTAFEATEFETGTGGKFYEFWIHCIMLILIPWFTVFAMNMKIIQQIGKSNERMADKKTSQSVKKSKKSENQVTRLLLGVTFSFLFFIGIQCVVQCLWMQQPSSANLELVSQSFAFAKTGIVFNSSLNFVFYCMMGRRFRLELFSLLRIKSSKDFQLSSLVDTSSTNTSGTTSSSGM